MTFNCRSSTPLYPSPCRCHRHYCYLSVVVALPSIVSLSRLLMRPQCGRGCLRLPVVALQLLPCSHWHRPGHHCHCRLTVVTQVVVKLSLSLLLWPSLQWRRCGGGWVCAGDGVDAVTYRRSLRARLVHGLSDAASLKITVLAQFPLPLLHGCLFFRHCT